MYMASTELTVIAPEKKHIKSKRGMKQRWHAIYNEVTDLLTLYYSMRKCYVLDCFHENQYK